MPRKIINPNLVPYKQDKLTSDSVLGNINGKQFKFGGNLNLNLGDSVIDPTTQKIKPSLVDYKQDKLQNSTILGRINGKPLRYGGDINIEGGGNGGTTDKVINIESAMLMVNNGKFSSSTKSMFYFSASEETYSISVEGLHDRFFVLGCNGTPSVGETYEIIARVNTGDTTSNKQVYLCDNSDKAYKYIAIFTSYQTNQDDLIVDVSYYINEDYTPYNCYKSSSLVKTAATYSELIEKYDLLVEEYSPYITRNTLGNDDFGNTIYEYILATKDYNTNPNGDWGLKRSPDDVIKKPTILLCSGTHGYERCSIMAMYQMIKDLCEYNERLISLREAFVLRVIPCNTPSAFNADSRANGNGVNINRNFNASWNYEGKGTDNYSGASVADQKETQIVQAWVDAHTDAMAFFDWHNSGFSNEITYIGGSPSDATVAKIKKSFLKGMDKVGASWKKEELVTEADILSYTGAITNNGTSDKYAQSKGIPSMTIETSWDVGGSGKHSPTSNRIGAECGGNFFLQMVEDFTLK